MEKVGCQNVKIVVRNAKVKGKKRNGFKIIALAVLVLFVVIAYNSVSLQKEKRALEKQYSELQENLQSEQERSEQLEDRAAYMQTIRYIEEIAREKLGLVYEDEIIFRPESQE